MPRRSTGGSSKPVVPEDGKLNLYGTFPVHPTYHIGCPSLSKISSLANEASINGAGISTPGRTVHDPRSGNSGQSSMAMDVDDVDASGSEFEGTSKAYDTKPGKLWSPIMGLSDKELEDWEK